MVITFLPTGVPWVLWPGVAGPLQPTVKANRAMTRRALTLLSPAAAGEGTRRSLSLSHRTPRLGEGRLVPLIFTPQLGEVAIWIADEGSRAFFFPADGQRRGDVREGLLRRARAVEHETR